MQNNLSVLMNGIAVGELERHSNGLLTFAYTQEWLEQPGARPISLSLPLQFDKFSGNQVYNFFDNLLPDNPKIRARIQAKFHAPTDQPFDLLANIGKDCIGAIQICDAQEKDIKKITAEPLSDQEIANILKNYQEAPLGMLLEQDDFRISLAGAQEKSGFLLHNGKWCRPIGTTPTSHIFKLPIGMLEEQQIDLTDSCENEWLCAQITKAFSIPVAECEIHRFKDIKALVTKRFDRRLSSDNSWLMRLPQEDLCQALGYSPNLKYQADGGPGIVEIMKLLLNSDNSLEDREMFFKSQVLFFLLAAIDGHAKNFSIFLEAGGKFKLTPLYDIMSAYPLLASKQLQERKIKMAMALKGKNNHYHWKDLQYRHFISTAKIANFSIKSAQKIIHDMLNQVESVIDQVTAILPKEFPNKISEPIFSGMLKMSRKLHKALN